MKKAIATLYDEKFAELAALSIPTIKRCAKLNKADLIVWDNKDQFFFKGERPTPWEKIPMCEGILKDGYDVVLWFDIDSIFVGDDNDLFRLSDKPIVINKPVGKFGSAKFNTGHMFLQNHDATFSFLTDVTKKEEYIYNTWYENAAAIEVYDKQKNNIALKSFCRLVDLTQPQIYAINSPYPIVHYPGGTLDTKKVYLKLDTLRAKYT